MVTRALKDVFRSPSMHVDCVDRPDFGGRKPRGEGLAEQGRGLRGPRYLAQLREAAVPAQRTERILARVATGEAAALSDVAALSMSVTESARAHSYF